MTATVINGDAQALPLAAESIDTIITDPPYGLGFMGKAWDHGMPGVPFWLEALRVAKPGAHLLAFGGTRTFHRLACAIEDAGWQIRDCLMWMYGSGFPKSHDISKAIDRAAGAEREVVGKHRKAGDIKGGRLHSGSNEKGVVTEILHTAPTTPLAQLWDGWGTALAPAWEPILIAMKSIDGTFARNAERHGVAGLWIDGGRVGTDTCGWGSGAAGGNTWNNENSGLCKPDAPRPVKGRWPPNCILDEHAAGLLDEQSGVTKSTGGKPTIEAAGQFGFKRSATNQGGLGDSGGASRFFYVAKAPRAERDAGLADGRNAHPTVKPLALMRHLARLTRTPTGGTVLDPFCGSGSTGMAAVCEDRSFVGVDLSPEYCEIARQRIAHVKRHGPDWKADQRQTTIADQMELLK